MIFELQNPPEFMITNKAGDKVYLTANLFYAIPGNVFKESDGMAAKRSMVSAVMRKKNVINFAKTWLFAGIGEQKAWGGSWFSEFPLAVEIVVANNKTGNWDIDNKGYFWSKVLLDLLREKKAIPEDHVRVISSLTLRYEKSNKSFLRITIKEDNQFVKDGLF
jgi:hypothetical protein